MRIFNKNLQFSASFTLVIAMTFIVMNFALNNFVSAFFNFPGTGGRRGGKKDLYSILGVNRKATDKEINKAFRKLSMEWHPDSSKHENAKEVYSEILKAKGVLGDSEKRKIYDQHGVIEGEDGVPSAEQRKQQGGRHPFQFNPFQEFFNEREEFHRQYYRQQQRQQAEPIKFNDKYTPDLDLQRFSRMRDFRGPKLFAVFAYVDFSQESRIFAHVWDRVSASSSGSSPSSSAMSPSQFDGLISFTRLNLQKNEVVMNLAGIAPQGIPLIFVVRDGVAEVIDPDCIAIIPNSISQMTDVLTMCLMDYANDVMKAAHDEVVSAVSKSIASSTDGVLRTAKQVFDFIFVKHRFQTVLLVDKSHPGVNAVPTAAAVRSQFSDIVIAFVEKFASNNDDVNDIFSPTRVCKKRWSSSLDGNNNNNKKTSSSSSKIIINKGDIAWLYKPSSSSRTFKFPSKKKWGSDQDDDEDSFYTAEIHRICSPDKSFTLSGRGSVSQHAMLVAELSIELMGEPMANQHPDIRLFARPSAALLSPTHKSEHRDVAKLITGNTINQVFGAEVDGEVNKVAKRLVASRKMKASFENNNNNDNGDNDDKILTHVIVQLVSSSSSSSAFKQLKSSQNKITLGYKNSERLAGNFDQQQQQQRNRKRTTVNLIERIHSRDVFTIDIDQEEKIPDQFRNLVLNENNTAVLLIVSLTHDTDPSSSSDEKEKNNNNLIISLLKSQIQLLTISIAANSFEQDRTEKYVEGEILKQLIGGEHNRVEGVNSKFELVFDSANRDHNKNILFKPFIAEVKQKIREKHGDDNDEQNNNAGGDEKQSEQESSSSSYRSRRDDDLYDGYDYNHVDYLQFIVRIAGYDRYPPEPWYQGAMRWVFWILRRLLSGFSLMMIPVLYFLKNYILGPIWRRIFGGRNDENNNAGRPVPNNNGNALLATSVYGLITFDKNEVSSSRPGDLFLVAVSTFSNSNNNNNKAQFTKSHPAAKSNSIFDGFDDLKSKQMSSQVKLRGCYFNNANNNNQTLFKKIVDELNNANASKFYRTPQNDAEGGVFFVAMRRNSNGVIRGAVMTTERNNVKTFVERVLEGLEPLKIEY